VVILEPIMVWGYLHNEGQGCEAKEDAETPGRKT
jgi:hypothetical protein